MKRIDRIRAMSVDQMAAVLVELGFEEQYCHSDCDCAENDEDCTHPVECCKCWLESEEISDSSKENAASSVGADESGGREI